MTDLDLPAPGDGLPATVWVTVAEAAERSGIDTSTIRRWYRTGRLPTQRTQGSRGAYLVPLDGVLALSRGDDVDEFTADLIDLNASYWSSQTEAAREEAAAARDELARARMEAEEARNELDVARRDLDRTTAELARSEGQLEVMRRRLQTAEAELTKLEEISLAVGSITDNSWLALPTNAYRSPVRPQGMAAANGPLSDLPAATQRDAGTDTTPPPDPREAEPVVEPVVLALDPDASDDVVAAPPARPPHRLGQHDDDLLPQPEKKGRRGRR